MLYDPNYLAHYGRRGMKWGIRQWQNKDGSLTPAGRIHYGYGTREDHAKNVENSEANRQRILEGRRRFEKAAEKINPNEDHSGNTEYFNLGDGSSEYHEFEGVDDPKYFKQQYTATIQKMHNAFDQIEADRKASNKGKIFDRTKEMAAIEQDKLFWDLMDDFMADSVMFIDQLPEKDQDAAAAYVYQLLGWTR
jgi:hypothetical protein